MLDAYFEDITVEPVAKGEGWRRIEALPPLFPDLERTAATGSAVAAKVSARLRAHARLGVRVHGCVSTPSINLDLHELGRPTTDPRAAGPGGGRIGDDRSCAPVPRPTRSTNQPPPLEGVNWFEHDRALLEAVEREGGAWGKERLTPVRRVARATIDDPARRAGQSPPAAAAHPRPLRPSHRRGRVPPRLARVARSGGRRAGACAALERGAARRPCRTRGVRLSAQSGRKRRLLPARHDLRSPRGARRCAGAGRRLAAEDPFDHLRSPARRLPPTRPAC